MLEVDEGNKEELFPSKTDMTGTFTQLIITIYLAFRSDDTDIKSRQER